MTAARVRSEPVSSGGACETALRAVRARGTTEEAHVSAPRREEVGEDARLRRAGGPRTQKKRRNRSVVVLAPRGLAVDALEEARL